MAPLLAFANACCDFGKRKNSPTWNATEIGCDSPACLIVPISNAAFRSLHAAAPRGRRRRKDLTCHGAACAPWQEARPQAPSLAAPA
eukprot:7926270-Pyramimonas_sp.AAC.1